MVERIVIEIDPETKKELKILVAKEHDGSKTMKELITKIILGYLQNISK